MAPGSVDDDPGFGVEFGAGAQHASRFIIACFVDEFGDDF